jgi:hypothetical protein
MEQVPHIAMFCQEYKTQLELVVPDYLLPMVVKFLTDTNNQVKKKIPHCPGTNVNNFLRFLTKMAVLAHM